MSSKKINWKEAKKLRRAAAAKKRKEKEKCWLCGQRGHTRDACPGLDDGGSSQSVWKGKKNNKKGKNKRAQRGERRGRRSNDQIEMEGALPHEVIPDSFGAYFIDGFCNVRDLSIVAGIEKQTLDIIGAIQPECTGLLIPLFVCSTDDLFLELPSLKNQEALGGNLPHLRFSCGVDLEIVTKLVEKIDMIPTGSKANDAVQMQLIEAKEEIRLLVSKISENIGHHGDAIVAIGPAGLDMKLARAVTRERSERISKCMGLSGTEASLFANKITETVIELQRFAFELQLKLAKRLNVPILAHLLGDTKDSDRRRQAETIFTSVLASELKTTAQSQIRGNREEGLDSVRVLLRGFALRPRFAAQLLNAFPDLWVAFDGSLTFRRAEIKDMDADGEGISLRDFAFDVPLDRFIIESNAPYCRPRATETDHIHVSSIAANAAIDATESHNKSESSEYLGPKSERKLSDISAKKKYRSEVDDNYYLHETRALRAMFSSGDSGQRDNSKINVRQSSDRQPSSRIKNPSLPRHVPLIASHISQLRASAHGINTANVLQQHCENSAKLFRVESWEKRLR